MKYLRTAVLIIFSALAILFVYANTRTLSPAQRLKPVTLATFTLHGNVPAENVEALQHDLKQTTGITACKINTQSKITAVIYEADQTSLQIIKSKITNTTGVGVSAKIFEATSGACPVHNLDQSFSNLISLLDLRH